MRIYSTNISNIKTDKGELLAGLLSQLGVQLLDEHVNEQVDVEKIDAVILSGEGQEKSVPYVIALALAKRKPILCLLQKGSRINETIQVLRQDKSISRKFTISFYTPSTLKREIHLFINKLEGGGLKEVPSIKFTLRITPSMERYLLWKSRKTGLSKADFLRKMIKDRIIDQDKEYGEV